MHKPPVPFCQEETMLVPAVAARSLNAAVAKVERIASRTSTLYLPASWLHAGDNDIVIYDLDAAPECSIKSIRSWRNRA